MDSPVRVAHAHAVLVDQFTRLRDGDRYFYLNDPGLKPYLDEIENTSLEETAVELVPADEVPNRLRAGAIDHALVIAALAYLMVLAASGVGPRTL